MYDILDKIQRIQTFLSSENITFFSIINSHTSQKAGSTDGAGTGRKAEYNCKENWVGSTERHSQGTQGTRATHTIQRSLPLECNYF